VETQGSLTLQKESETSAKKKKQFSGEAKRQTIGDLEVVGGEIERAAGRKLVHTEETTDIDLQKAENLKNFPNKTKCAAGGSAASYGKRKKQQPEVTLRTLGEGDLLMLATRYL